MIYIWLVMNTSGKHKQPATCFALAQISETSANAFQIDNPDRRPLLDQPDFFLRDAQEAAAGLGNRHIFFLAQPPVRSENGRLHGEDHARLKMAVELIDQIVSTAAHAAFVRTRAHLVAQPAYFWL